MEKKIEKEYQRCGICFLNHTHGRKHIYCRKHVGRVKAIISKFQAKVKTCKTNTDTVEVHDLTWENGAKLWCYFCTKEVLRHERLETVCIRDASFLRHLTCEVHANNVTKFIKTNKVRVEVKGLSLPVSRLEIFQKKSKSAVQKFIDTREIQRQKAVATYKEQRKERLSAIRQGSNLQDSRPSTGDKAFINEPSTSRSVKGAPVKGFRTVGAKGDGLTCIALPKIAGSVGNVHTDASPPWLSQANKGRAGPVSKSTYLKTESSATADIGPTFQTYKQHLENEKKRKLPANRVGANRQGESFSSDWLPSFGHVWSSSSRTQQRKFLSKKRKTETGVPSFTITNQNSDISANTNEDFNGGEINVPHIPDMQLNSSKNEMVNGQLNYQHGSIDTKDFVGANDSNDTHVGYIRNQSSSAYVRKTITARSPNIPRIQIATNLL